MTLSKLGWCEIKAVVFEYLQFHLGQSWINFWFD